ncbi:MAG: hypothetical protein JXB62_11690 [Pirellulales bacterium]|nr:hypothetical protein [Pirellulales bacterium]
MQGDLASGAGVWPEAVLVLAVGTAVIAGLAAIGSHWVASAAWRRTVWQIATLGLLAMTVIELTGTGPALVCLGRCGMVQTPCPRSDARTKVNPVRTVISPDEPAELEATDRRGGLTSWPTGSEAAGQEDAFLGPRSAALSSLPSPLRPSLRLPEGPLLEEPAFADGQSIADGDAFWAMPADFESRAAAGRSTRWEECELSEASPEMAPETAARAMTRQPVSDQPVVAVAESPSCRRSALAAGASRGAAWLGLLWLLGTSAIVIRGAAARAVLWGFRRRHVVVGDEVLCRQVSTLARSLGLRRRVSLLESSTLRAPVAFGVLRPTVVLPRGFAATFDGRQQEAMLAHELAHLAAGDPAWHLLADLVCGVLWWHPLAWWSGRQLRTAGEAAADEASLLVPGGPDALADCLVALGRELTAPRQLGWLSVEGPPFRSSLGRRVQRLLSLPSRSWRAPCQRRLAAARTVIPVVLVIVTVSCTAWVRPQANLSEGETTMSLLTSSWRRSLAAGVLAALLTTVSGDAAADDTPTGEPARAIAGDQLDDAGLQLAMLAEDEQKREEGEARERAEREGDKDRPEADRGERDRPREGEGDRPKEREGDQPKEREGDRPKEREGDQPREREGDRPRDAERERGEKARVIAELQQEMRGLAEKAEAIKREIGDRGPDRDDQARRLHAQLREIQERMAQVAREMGEGQRPRPKMAERRRAEAAAMIDRLKARHHEIEMEANAIRERMQGLRDGQDEAARDLEQAMQRMRKEAERVEQEIHRLQGAMVGRPEREGPPPAEREQLRRHIEELKREIGRLSEAGRHDEAERLKLEGREIMKRLEGRPEPEPPEDIERRMHHLRVAIENLHAAGLHEAAERLEQDAARRLEELRRQGREIPEPPPAERMIDEMRGQMDEMRRQMDEMRQLMKELLERERQRER